MIHALADANTERDTALNFSCKTNRQQNGNQEMIIHIQSIRKGQLSESFLLAVAPRCQRQWEPGNFVEFKLDSNRLKINF